MLANDKISAGHAKVLLGLDEDTQKKVADSISGQKLSVRETEVLVRDLKASEKKVRRKVTKQKNKISIFLHLRIPLKPYKNLN